MNKHPVTQLSKLSTTKKPLFIILGIVGLSIAWTIVALVTPFFIGDGLAMYTGARQQLAKKAISDVSYVIDNKLRWSYIYHIEDVRPTTVNEAEKSCIPYSGELSIDSNNPRYYTVTLTESRLFGVNKHTIIVDGCNAFGPNKDGPYHKR